MGVNIISQIAEENYKQENVKTIIDAIKHISSTSGQGLENKKPGLQSLRIAVLSTDHSVETMMHPLKLAT